MKKNGVKWLLLMIPMCTLVLLSSCSEEAPSKEEKLTEKDIPAKPLVEREPDVREYFEVLNKMIEDYLTVGETLVTTVEKLDSGDLGMLESAVAAQALVEAWESIDELEESLEQQGTIRENIEAKLNAKDMLEFKDMYTISIERMEALTKRIEAIDLSSYLP